MKLLYFAWVKAKIGTGQETVDPPAEVTDVASLVTWLRSRGDGYAEALEQAGVIRVAVNQHFATWDTPVGPEDEVALFPPMTGG